MTVHAAVRDDVARLRNGVLRPVHDEMTDPTAVDAVDRGVETAESAVGCVVGAARHGTFDNEATTASKFFVATGSDPFWFGAFTISTTTVPFFPSTTYTGSVLPDRVVR